MMQLNSFVGVAESFIGYEDKDKHQKKSMKTGTGQTQ